MSQAGWDMVLELMQESQLPLTLEVYLEMNHWPGIPPTTPWEELPGEIAGSIPVEELLDDGEMWISLGLLTESELSQKRHDRRTKLLGSQSGPGQQPSKSSANTESKTKQSGPSGGDIVSQIMRNHGMTEDEAIENMELFGG